MTEQDLQFEAEYAEESKKEMLEFFDKYQQESIKVMDKDTQYVEKQDEQPKNMG